ncbi:MAG: hypothetical protein WAR37_00925 [Candidatus Microsaccharimonas sp.]
MARLPRVGADNGNWGDILNEFLEQSHSTDGTLKTDSVGAAQIKSNSVTNASIANNSVSGEKIIDGTLAESKLSSDVIAKLNTIGSGSIADGTITNAKIATNAAIDQTKISGLATSLSAKADTTTVNTGLANKADLVHTHTPAQVGLGNVNNTSDADKPISTAQATAINAKLDISAAPDLIRSTTIEQSNVNGLTTALAAKADSSTVTTTLSGKADVAHTHTPSQVGLGNVDNTSDANKPISTAQATALGNKLDSSVAPELIRDTIAAALVAGPNITITPNDSADTITIASTASGSTNGYAVNVPSGSTSPAITHNLGTRDVHVTVYDISSDPWVRVTVDVLIPTDGNTITLGFLTAPTVNQYRVVVVRV